MNVKATVINFNIIWHGCNKCYSDDTINTKNQIDMLTLRKRTLEKNGKIRAAEYNLVEVYECELKRDKDFMTFLERLLDNINHQTIIMERTAYDSNWIGFGS